MGAQLLERTRPSDPPTRETLTRHDYVRLTLLVGWLVLFAGVLLLGERPVDLARLDSAVTSGDVRTVHVSPGLRGTGNVVQEAHWRTGLRRYVVRVNAVSSPGAGAPRNPLPVVHRDLADRIRAEHPRQRIDRVAARYRDVDMLGRRVPPWLEHARLLLGIGALLLLVGGPRPWRASRWAWFWLVAASGLPTYGILAFLVLSGRTPLLPAPSPTARRLTGGWALMVALLVHVAVGWLSPAASACAGCRPR